MKRKVKRNGNIGLSSCCNKWFNLFFQFSVVGNDAPTTLQQATKGGWSCWQLLARKRQQLVHYFVQAQLGDGKRHKSIVYIDIYIYYKY